MSKGKPFLFEIGTEELPPKSLKKLAEVLHDQVIKQLENNKLIEQPVSSQFFATPRRLAVLIENVLENQPDQVLDRRGPALAQAYDDQGQPTKAALGFAQSVGLDVGQLKTQKTDKGEWLFCQTKQKGQSAKFLIPESIELALKALPIPKRMRWGTLDAEFVRPVKWLVMLLDDEVIEAEILATKTDRYTHGHRFHAVRRLRLRRATDYQNMLEQDGLVVPDFEQRRQMILDGITELAEVKQANVLLDYELLDEVTGLVELPVPLLGIIDESFMNLPQEVLISSMQDHQKYFPLIDADNQMLPYFITVSNIRSKDKSSVISGNQRVLRSRLSDAQFFFDSDRKISLEQRISSLTSVLFHKKLGTVADKANRVGLLAAFIADALGAEKENVIRSAQLCKTDLVTDMVGEFPELQGVMGRYYALHDGETDEVAQAIEEHYWPRFAGDNIPQTSTGAILALADKLDTICGIFSVAEVPTGDRDPFGLRRSALGLLRILIEGNIELDLKQTISHALKQYPNNNSDSSTAEAVYEFIFERLRSYYQAQEIETREYQAVAIVKPTSPLDFDKRIKAVNEFSKLESAGSLIEANKRIAKLLQKIEIISNQVDSDSLTQPEEITLHEKVTMLSQQIEPMVTRAEYTQVLKLLSDLKQPIDSFFDNVMVMDEDSSKRQNRVALLNNIKELFNQTADISYLN